MASSDRYISLNVGGICYTTSLFTLNSYPDSMLGKMFGDGRVPPKPDKNGHFIIDRDGKTFRFVLNFMRDKRLCLPSSFEEYDQLLAEAEFFQLNEMRKELLSKMIPKPTPNIAEELPQKKLVVLRKDMTVDAEVPILVLFRSLRGKYNSSSDVKQKRVCVVEAKKETWFKLKSFASASLGCIPVEKIVNLHEVSMCHGMESKIYPKEMCPSVITCIMQDGFKLESTVTIDMCEYLIFTM